MSKFSLLVNGQSHEVDVDGKIPLLWVIREHLKLTGTKYGCGIGQCGSCTVHIDGEAVKSCILPVENVSGQQMITTIEGLSEHRDHPLQLAWVEAQVPQCGYCQSGQIMQAATLLDKNPTPSEQEIRDHMNGNLCRCGTYLRIIKAIQRATEPSAGS